MAKGSDLNMSRFRFFQNLFLKRSVQDPKPTILSIKAQTQNWRRADRKMGWDIDDDEFEQLEAFSGAPMTDDIRSRGFIGCVVFYGFGDDGRGNADAILSAKLAWDYAVKTRKNKTWQCEYIDFSRPQDMRLRPGAPVRPKGFYHAWIQPGKRFINMTVAQVRKKFNSATGLAAEGFQFLTITHPHFAELMNQRKIPFMALADYDVAPHGFNDFYDVPQLFCSNGKLGLGIGNVDRNYPLFGIPILQFIDNPFSQKQHSE